MLFTFQKNHKELGYLQFEVVSFVSTYIGIDNMKLSYTRFQWIALGAAVRVQQNLTFRIVDWVLS